MALTFGAISDRVNCGSAAALDDLALLTVLTWIYPTTITAGRVLVAKGNSSNGWFFNVRTAGAFGFTGNRVVANSQSQSSSTPITANAWHFAAATWDQVGLAVAPKLYYGNLTTIAAEPTYSTQTVGSGALDSDAALVLTLGNRTSNDAALQGRIAVAAIFDRILTLEEIRRWQFRPRVMAGCLGYWQLGFAGTGTQPDWSGNGNNGTVTGATVSDHVPLGPPFGYAATLPYVVAAGGGYTLAAAQGSYTLTGQAVGLRAARQIAAAQGSYVLAGQVASLLASRAIAVQQGSYSLSGQDAALRAARLLAAAQGTYSLTGQAAGLLAGRAIVAQQGSYTLTGQAVSLLAKRFLTAAQGSYGLTGQDVTLTYTPLGGYTLSVQAGNYALTGQAANLLFGRLLRANQGAYVLTGQDAQLLIGHLLAAGQGSYSLTGQASALRIARLLAMAQGSYILSGQAVTLVWSGQVAPTTPPGRVYVVPAEDRTFVIVFEDRTFTVH